MSSRLLSSISKRGQTSGRLALSESRSVHQNLSRQMSNDAADESLNVTKLRKGPIMKEQFGDIIDEMKALPHYTRNIEELPLISTRSVDENGFFVRSSPPLFSALTPEQGLYDLTPDTFYFSSGDVEVYVSPLSPLTQPGQFEMLFRHRKPDASVVPLIAPINKHAERIHYLATEVAESEFELDTLHPEGMVVSKIESQEVVLAQQLAGQYAIDHSKTVVMGGRSRVVTNVNHSFKAWFNKGNILRPLKITYEILNDLQSLEPHHEMTFEHVDEEISAVFEPALVFAASLRSTVEEQQEAYDALPADQKGTKRIIFAFPHTCQLRHIENVYDLLPVLTKNNMTYLKYGYAAAYEQLHKININNLEVEIDFDEPAASNLAWAATDFYSNFAKLKSNADPWSDIHRLFAQIYGPNSSEISNCGVCGFSYTDTGDVKLKCKNVKKSLFGKVSCGSAFPEITFGAIPEMFRFPTPKSAVPSELHKWFEGAKAYKRKLAEEKKLQEGGASTVSFEPETVTAADVADDVTKVDAETQTDADDVDGKPRQAKVDIAEAEIIDAEVDKSNNKANKTKSEEPFPGIQASFSDAVDQMEKMSKMPKDEIFEQIKNTIRNSDINLLPPHLHPLAHRVRKGEDITPLEVYTALGISKAEMAELHSLVMKKKSGEISYVTFLMKAFPIIKEIMTRVRK